MTSLLAMAIGHKLLNQDKHARTPVI